MDGSNDGDVIKISLGEANSAHVDDLLRRQASLRGESGIARDRRGKWYYQSWFVLMLAGGLAAFLAWAAIEPYFSDNAVVRGNLDRVTVKETPEPVRIIAPRQSDPSKLKTIAVTAEIVVRGQTVQILPSTLDLHSKSQLDLTRLTVGSAAEAYTEPVQTPEGRVLWVAAHIDPAPTVTTPDSDLSMERINQRNTTMGMMVFSVTAALIGLMLGAVDGTICRMWRRAVVSGLVGLVIGCIGGFILTIIANLAYTPLSQYAAAHEGTVAGGLSPFGFGMQVLGRALAWGLVGVSMGLGQGIALRSGRLVVFGLIGGIVGGVLGGLLFDPIDLLMLGPDHPSAWASRMVGFTVIGLSVGAMIGVVELLARDAWLRMEQGPLAGKEFLVFKDVMRVGSSSRSDIYLFNDPQVLAHHATIRAVGEETEIESADEKRQVLVNDRAVRRARLRHGDKIGLGRTVFIYQQRGA